jgi:transposase
MEAEAKAAGLGAAERLGLRRKKAEPIVEGLKEGIGSARASTLSRSALGKACDYALGRWGQLRRFLDYGQLELSNNLAENAIRPVAIGRNCEQLGIRQSYNGEEDSHFDCPIVA